MKIARYTSQSEVQPTRILFYSICVVVLVFITSVRIKEIECAYSFCRF